METTNIKQQNAKDIAGIVAKGAIVGGSMLIPGVSGGTMAMLLNVYDRIIQGITGLLKGEWKHLKFLAVFGIGGVLGLLLLATPLDFFLTTFPKPTLFFFMGAVIGGVPLMFKKSGVTAFSWKVIVYPLIGLAIVLAIGNIPENILQFSSYSGISRYLLIFLVGIVVAIALLLPGISGSYMMLILGMYDTALQAVKHLDFAFLIPLALGGLTGILLIAKILEKAMTNYPQGTYLTILGFVIGSIFALKPGIPTGFEIPICICTFGIAFIVLYKFSKLEQ